MFIPDFFLPITIQKSRSLNKLGDCMSFLFYVIGLFSLNVLTPGASFILTLQTAMASGRSAGISVGLGLATADICYATAALLGVATLLQHNAGIGLLVACFGGAWIARMGLKMLLKAKVLGNTVTDSLKVSRSQAYKTGLLAGLINPQAIVFFSTVFLGALVDKPSTSEALSLIGSLGVASMMLRGSLAAIATLHAVRNRYLAKRRQVEKVSGTVLMFFGVKMACKATLALGAKVVAVVGGLLPLFNIGNLFM